MNGEKGIDYNTDFQRSYVNITIADEKTSLLMNNESKEFLFLESPTIKEGYTNYHLHILYPEIDYATGKKNASVKGSWSLLESTNRGENNFLGTHQKTFIFDPDIHSIHCKRILASTQNLKGTNSNLITIDFNKHPNLDNTKKKDVYNICNSFVEKYAKMQGELSYVMVQPLCSTFNLGSLGEHTSVEYKTDINDFIALFPAVAYNKASLENQIY